MAVGETRPLPLERRLGVREPRVTVADGIAIFPVQISAWNSVNTSVQPWTCSTLLDELVGKHRLVDGGGTQMDALWWIAFIVFASGVAMVPVIYRTFNGRGKK